MAQWSAMAVEPAPSPSATPPETTPAPAPTVVVIVPTPQVIVRDNGPSRTDTVAAWATVLALIVAIVTIFLTGKWGRQADRRAADMFTATSDMDALRQLNAMGIQLNAPLQPVARGLLDSPSPSKICRYGEKSSRSTLAVATGDRWSPSSRTGYGGGSRREGRMTTNG
jgi:hypothetical protein